MGLAIAADVALLEALGPCIPAFVPPPGLLPSRARKKQGGVEKPRPLGSPRRPQPFLLHLQNFSVSCSAGTVLPAVSCLPQASREPSCGTDEGGVWDAPAPQAADADVPLRYMQVLSVASLTTTVDPGAQSLDVELEDLVLECEERPGEAPGGTAEGPSDGAPADSSQAQPSLSNGTGTSPSNGNGAAPSAISPRDVEPRDGIAVPEAGPKSSREAIRRRWDEYGRAARGTQDARGAGAAGQGPDGDRAGPAAGPHTTRLLHLRQVSVVVAPLSGSEEAGTARPHATGSSGQSVAVEVAAAGVSACFDAAAVLGSAVLADNFVKTVMEVLPRSGPPTAPPSGPPDDVESERVPSPDEGSGPGTPAGDRGRSPGDRGGAGPPPAVQVAVRVADVSVRAPLADTVEWSVVIEGASAVSGSRSAALEGAAMCLNGRRLIYVGAASIEGVRLPGDPVGSRGLCFLSSLI